jgi:sporulation protein YlmC with PRC-barrel domain
MSANEFPGYDRNSTSVRPLTEVPALRVADPERDVRGWDVLDRDGRRLGTVADLLVDIDRLRADTLLVSLTSADPESAMVVVPLHGLSSEQGSHRRLVPGEGMPPIGVRYQSTTRYAIWVAMALGIIALAWWVLELFE